MCEENKVGDRIKKIRETLSLSQKDFARQLGISQSAISSYEKKIRTPPETLLRLIAGIYNVNINYLEYNKDPMFIEEKHEFKIQPDKIQLFDNFCKAYNLDANSVKMLQEYMLLPENHKHIVNEFLKFIKNINK